MSRSLRLTAGGFAVIALLGIVSPTPAAALAPQIHQCPGGQVPLFAGGGTGLTNGFFFPGTALYNGQDFIGAPLVVPQGCDVFFINTDLSAVTNGHQIVSFKRRKGVPVFLSGFVAGPATATIELAKLKPDTYPYFCSVHYNMFGLIQVVPTP